MKMIFRDPNTLYRTAHEVGVVEAAKATHEAILLYGQVDPEAIQNFGLDQIILLDLSNRYITGVVLPSDGEWSAGVKRGDIGNDNSALEVNAFAGSSANNYIFPVRAFPSARTSYKKVVSLWLPSSSKDVPSIKNDLRALVTKATQVPYVARSIHNSIPTGNNYQTLALDNSLHHGGRQSRECFLNRIDFTGKTVLDIGANTGENSRIARKLGASLVDGYEYDPYFVEIGRVVNALCGMTRVSLFQGDCTRPELFEGMKYDVVLALAVWVYIEDTIKQISRITDVMIFETHTLDHGIEFYYQPILKYFPHVISLGYSEKPIDPHKSRMFVIFGKEKTIIDQMVKRRFLRVKPYFENKFIRRNNKLNKAQILRLAEHCYEKHVNRPTFDMQDYIFGTETYFEVFLAGLHQFAGNDGKIKGLINPDNLYLAFLVKGVKKKQIDQNLRKVCDNSDWLIRKVSNKYEDAFNILNGNVDRVAPVEVVPDQGGKLTFTTTSGEEIRCEIFDGHHRFFMCELAGIEKIHFIVKDGKTDKVPQRFRSTIARVLNLVEI